jgi:hypothetical protein
MIVCAVVLIDRKTMITKRVIFFCMLFQVEMYWILVRIHFAFPIFKVSVPTKLLIYLLIVSKNNVNRGFVIAKNREVLGFFFEYSFSLSFNRMR